LVMSVIAVTTEYRTGTIKATFMAVPNRTAALLAKAATVALVSGAVGEIIAFGAYGLGRLIKPHADLAIDTAAAWRFVAGGGLCCGGGCGRRDGGGTPGAPPRGGDRDPAGVDHAGGGPGRDHPEGRRRHPAVVTLGAGQPLPHSRQ